MRFVAVVLCGVLLACTPGRGMSGAGHVSEGVGALEQECAEHPVVVLCQGPSCELYWCQQVAPVLERAERTRRLGELRAALPRALELRMPAMDGVAPPATFFTRGAGSTPASPSPSARSEVEPLRPPGDVIWEIAHRQKPGDVAQWWSSEMQAHPEQWQHPLSQWEQRYLVDFRSARVPEPLRIRAPVDPEHLTAKEAREAAKAMGPGLEAARRYACMENRRRIVGHYVFSHPATVRLQLGLYALVRDANPLHFALERGWQVARGEEMFTQQEVSQLGAAAEFFTALAMGWAVQEAASLGVSRAPGPPPPLAQNAPRLAPVTREGSTLLPPGRVPTRLPQPRDAELPPRALEPQARAPHGPARAPQASQALAPEDEAFFARDALDEALPDGPAPEEPSAQPRAHVPLPAQPSPGLVQALKGQNPTPQVAPGARLPQDVAVNPDIPRLKSTLRPISSSPTQNAQLQMDIQFLDRIGAKNIRVNQNQLTYKEARRVGINRPDLQFDFGGRRYCVEYDTPTSGRGLAHQSRITSNDPASTVILLMVP